MQYERRGEGEGKGREGGNTEAQRHRDRRDRIDRRGVEIGRNGGRQVQKCAVQRCAVQRCAVQRGAGWMGAIPRLGEVARRCSLR